MKTVVCLLTSALHPDWRCRIACVVKRRPAEVAVDRIRAISKRRLIEQISDLSRDQALALRLLITEMYGEPLTLR